MSRREEPQPTHFSPAAHAAFKQGGLRRLAGAAAVAVVILVVLALLGPDKETVERKFEFYGAPGELRIMPDISIVEGRDARQQIPQSLQQPPPPAEVVVDEEPDDPDALETVARPREAEPIDVAPVPDPSNESEDTFDLVEMATPMQSNPDYFIIRMLNPAYPLDASDSERRIPRVFVAAEAFVGPDGLVTDVVIRATNGGPAYSRAVIAAFKQWQFGWRVDPGLGRWMTRTWYFRSPYFTPEAQPGR
jgi:hypothetical protein